MKSIYQEILGDEFVKLHPKVQERFSINSDMKKASIGTGMMESVWHGPFYTYPFLAIGHFRNIMFPNRGKNVPFKIENWAYVDGFGRETVTWLRTFYFKKSRRFDAYMINSASRSLIVDYLGTHQHLAVDIHLSVDPNGGLRLISGDQRFYEGFLGFKFPLIFSGIAEVCEWFDDASGLHQIEVIVRNPTWGRLFGYRGSFSVEWIDTTNLALDAVRPIREEKRE